MPGRSRIGILGGTFDPIHVGHLIIAEEARVRLALERVLFVPARDPWRKTREDLADGADRLEMVRRAVAGNLEFSVSTVDLDRGGPSYSVDTVRDLRREMGNDPELYFILGVDALMDVPYWHDPTHLASQAYLVAVGRGGYQVEWDRLEQAIPGARRRVLLLEMPEVSISSTEVRRRVAAGESIRYWVPDMVAEYIREKGLYSRRQD